MSTIIAKSNTGSNIFVEDLGITIGTASITLTDIFSINDVCVSDDLKTYVENEQVFISDGIGWLTTECALTHITLETEYEDDINSDYDPYDYYPFIPDSTSGISERYLAKITIDNSKVAGTSNHENFPVYISVTKSFLRHIDYSGNVYNENGYDIVFRDLNGTKLDHEIDSYDSTNGELKAWVRLSTLYYNQDTIFYAYYGSDTTNSQENVSGVWNSGYEAVYHLKESGNGTANEFKDSTGNNNHGQGGEGNSSKTPSRIESYIGYGQDFDGSDDYIYSGTPSISNEFTISAWVHLDTVPSSNQRFVSIDIDTAVLRHNGSYSSGTLELYATIGGSLIRCRGTGALSSGQDYYVAGTWNGTRLRLFKNGSLVTPQVPSGNLASAGPIRIGRDGETPNGKIDEVRVSSIRHTNEWIETEYNNQSSPGDFFDMVEITGAGESSGGVIQIFDSVGNTDINNETPIPIYFASETYKDNTIFEHIASSTSKITVYETGIYRIGYSINWFEEDTADAHIQTRVRKNGNYYVPGSTSYRAGDNDNREEATCSLEFLVKLEIYDYVEIMCNGIGTRTSSVYTEPNASWVYMEKI